MEKDFPSLFSEFNSYVNGIQQICGKSLSVGGTPSTIFAAGKQWTTNDKPDRFGRGCFDDVLFFNTTLSLGEARMLYGKEGSSVPFEAIS